MVAHTYIAIDLKSFYASVACMDRHLDPLETCLVVADARRTEKTICLAVSPALKAYGIPGRARLFEVIQRVREINTHRQSVAPGCRLKGKSVYAAELNANPTLALDYIVATPHMARYMEISAQIYSVYLKFVSPEDIHVYSIDEVFIDATRYLQLYHVTAREFTMQVIQEVLRATGITATAGIGTNLFLAKVAMDIVAKHIPPDADGVRIAELDEMSFRQDLWPHQPLTDFWRIGHGYARKLAALGMHTLGDIARLSLTHEDILYRAFGVQAELLIDHAWGWEPCTIAAIKAYKPENNSLSSGQVLKEPYPYEKARIVVKEMIDQLALDLFEKRLVTDQLVLTIGYDIANLSDPRSRQMYAGPVVKDAYGRDLPKDAHGSIGLDQQTCSAKILVDAMMCIFDRVVDPTLLIRRINVGVAHLVDECDLTEHEALTQQDLFTDPAVAEAETARMRATLEKEKRMQRAILNIKKRLGKNAVLKGLNLLDGATACERNEQIGGHRK